MAEKEDDKAQTQEEDIKEKPAEPQGLIDEGNAVVDRMKRENDRRESLLVREEALHVQQQLSGKAEAGKEPEKPKEETPVEYMKRVMKNEV